MDVDVDLFGYEKRAAGRDEITLEVTQKMTQTRNMSGVVRLLIAIGICLFSVNSCFSQCGEEYWYHRIHQNDKISCNNRLKD